MEIYGSCIVVTVLIIFICVSLFTVGLTLAMIHLLVKGKVQLQVTPELILYPGSKALKKMSKNKDDDLPFMIVHENPKNQKKPDVMCSTIPINPLKEDE